MCCFYHALSCTAKWKTRENGAVLKLPPGPPVSNRSGESMQTNTNDNTTLWVAPGCCFIYQWKLYFSVFRLFIEWVMRETKQNQTVGEPPVTYSARTQVLNLSQIILTYSSQWILGIEGPDFSDSVALWRRISLPLLVWLTPPHWRSS